MKLGNYVLLILILSGCMNFGKISEIDTIIINIDISPDLIEENISSEMSMELTNEPVISKTIKLSNLDNELLKLIYELDFIKNDSILKFEYYFDNNELIFAKYRELIFFNNDEKQEQNISETHFYFNNSKLLKENYLRGRKYEPKDVPSAMEGHLRRFESD